MRSSCWVIFSLLALSTTPSAIAAPLTRAQLNQYEQDGRRFGLSSIEVAQVYEFIDKNDGLIRSLSAEKKINERAFRAIARELGLRNPGADPKALLELIKANATNAAKFEKENSALRKRIGVLESAVLRAPAEAILARADEAYAAGDLETAQSELNSLLELRGGELAGSVDAYQAAVETARALARSRGDRIMIDRIAEQSDPVLARMEKQARLTRWRNQVERAAIRYSDGQRLGRVSDLAEAANLYLNAALPIVPKADYSNEWAATQNDLGSTLAEQGARWGGEAGTALLARAVKAYEDALTVRTKAGTPAAWAATQNNLGHALVRQGELSGAEAGTALLSRAVKAFEDALTVHTKADAPKDWALTQNNLGNALAVQGDLSGGEAGTALLARAVMAFEDALTVRTKADAPEYWADTQTNLGGALSIQGERTGGEAGIELLARAVMAMVSALTVRTKADAPSAWVAIQNNLGTTLDLQGERTSGEAGTALRARAVKAYEDVLTVHTKADGPAAWALTQNNLGIALRGQGERTSGEAGTALLARAVKAYEAALTVYGPTFRPNRARAIAITLIAVKAEIAKRQRKAK